MSEVVSSKPSKTGKRWLHVSTRILVAVFMFIVVVGLLLNLAVLVGVWVVRASAYSAVTDVTSTMTHTLVVVNNGLGRVNTQVQDGRQKLTQVNDAAAKLGNRITLPINNSNQIYALPMKRDERPLITLTSLRNNNYVVLRFLRYTSL